MKKERKGVEMQGKDKGRKSREIMKEIEKGREKDGGYD